MNGEKNREMVQNIFVDPEILFHTTKDLCKRDKAYKEDCEKKKLIHFLFFFLVAIKMSLIFKRNKRVECVCLYVWIGCNKISISFLLLFARNVVIKKSKFFLFVLLCEPERERKKNSVF